jgi:hypothetical protein
MVFLFVLLAMMRKRLPIVDIGGIDTLEDIPPPAPLTLVTLISLFSKSGAIFEIFHICGRNLSCKKPL